MSILRQYIAPLIAVLIFSIALVAVSARIFLPSDMAAPAPIEDSPELGMWKNSDNFSLNLNSHLVGFFTAPNLY
ncbi:MAG: hypothetical protein AAF208_03000 [Cyanobacteria bacterium P01_A01_bin.45]